MKGDKVRWDVVTGDDSLGYRIYDAAAKRLFSVDPSTSSVIASDLSAPAARLVPPPPPPVGAPPGDPAAPGAEGAGATGGGLPAPGAAAAWTFTSLGPSSVGGYPCEHLRASLGGEIYDVCGARGMPTVPLAYVLPGAATTLPFLGALEGRGQFPLSVSRVAVGDGGAESLAPRLHVTQVRPEAVSDARFVLPNVPVTQMARPPLPTGPRLR